MGCYVHLTEESKESFVEDNCEKISKEKFLNSDYYFLESRKRMVLFFINNGDGFTALGVCYSKAEFDKIKDMMKTEKREVRFYTCLIDDFIMISDFVVYKREQLFIDYCSYIGI